MPNAECRSKNVIPKLIITALIIAFALCAVACQSSVPTDTLGGQSAHHISQNLFGSDATADARGQYGAPGNVSREDRVEPAPGVATASAAGEPVTVEDIDPDSGRVIRRVTFTAGFGAPMIFGDISQLIEIWNDAAGEASSRTDQDRTATLSPQVQANTGGAAGTQGDSTTSSSTASDTSESSGGESASATADVESTGSPSTSGSE
jgi:hypothetical protein